MQDPMRPNIKYDATVRLLSTAGNYAKLQHCNYLKVILFICIKKSYNIPFNTLIDVSIYILQ